MTDDDEGLVARWSRRKRAARPEPTEADAHDVSGGARAAPGAEAADAPATEEEVLEKLGLPDPDTLAEGDDFSAFMRHGVPDALRRRALRRLWVSNPALANLDGLVDYGEDFGAAALVPDVIATAYKVGRGFARTAAEADEEDPATAPDAPAAPPPAEPPADTGVALAEAGGEPPDAPDEAPDDGPVVHSAPDHPPEASPRPRRMRFRQG